MNEYQSFEYTVRQKCEGMLLLKRIFFILCYIALVLVWLIIGLKTKIIAPLVIFIPLTLFVLIRITWKYTKVEFEISLISGILSLSEIYGGRSRKTIFEIPLKSIDAIAPYDDEGYERVLRYAPELEYSALSSKNAEDVYFALFEDTNEKKVIFLFECDSEEKFLKICKFYNPSATKIK